MIDWYKQKTLLLLLVCSYWSGQLFRAAAWESDDKILLDRKLDLSNWIVQIPSQCSSIDSAYQEIYSFETESYYIDICRLGDDFYYRRQSKLNQSTIVIPAQAVFLGDVFQATDGKTNYFVGKDGDRYYSSVMQNSNEIVFEPELQQQPALSSEIAEANSTLPNVDTYQTHNASLELDSPDDLTLICTKEKSAFHPYLDEWQKLIGESTAIANKYAVNNGHDFVYSEQNPRLASINTSDGAVINLSIASSSETIEQVCVAAEPVLEE